MTISKNRVAQRKQSDQEIRGVNREGGSESVVGKICERGRS